MEFNMLEDLKNSHLKNIEFIKDLLLEYIDDYLKNTGFKDEDIHVFQDVLNNCDNIDYQDSQTVMAYTMLHLLDRYRRFQYIQYELVKSGYLKNKPHLASVQQEKLKYGHGRRYVEKSDYRYQVRILDVGTGPAPGLLAYSDFFDWYEKIIGSKIDIKGDYVEQSQGFRDFLHHFVEFGEIHKKKYHIPYHSGSFYQINEYQEASWGKNMRSRKYDLVILSNFLTTDEFFSQIKNDIEEIFKSMTNKSIILVVGASQSMPKYSRIYKTFEDLINQNKNSKHKEFISTWRPVYSKEIEMDYQDAIGEVKREYFIKLKEMLEEKYHLFSKIPKDVQNLICNAMSDKDRSKWRVDVYQKISRKLH